MRLLKNAYEQNLARTYSLGAWRWFFSLFPLIPDPWALYSLLQVCQPRIRDQSIWEIPLEL